MLVSVVVITYNQEAYIKQALDSILMQKRDFELEILVGDDCSTDSTPEIVAEYARKYPGIIKASLRTRNLGATRNSYELFVAAKGDYIAILEGDDYWIDDNKLMKQVDFLEKNPEYAACCCEFHYVNDKGQPLFEERQKILRGQLYDTDQIYTLKNLCESKLPSHACTLFIRNIFKDNGVSAEAIYKAHETIGDFTVVMLILSRGNIYRLKDAMACYRHIEKAGDSWSAKARVNSYHFYEIFMYHTYLEKYAKEVLGLDLHLRKTKEHAFYRMAMSCIKRKTRARKRCIKAMLRVTRDKSRYYAIYCRCRVMASVPDPVRDMYLFGIDKEIPKPLRKSWKQFYDELGGRKVILYGAGGGCIDFSNKYFCDIPVYCVVDNDPEKQGTYLDGYRVRGNGVFDTLEKEEYVVIITVGRHMNEIAQSLYDRGITRIYSYPVMESKRLKYFILKHFYRLHEYMDPK